MERKRRLRRWRKWLFVSSLALVGMLVIYAPKAVVLCVMCIDYKPGEL